MYICKSAYIYIYIIYIYNNNNNDNNKNNSNGNLMLTRACLTCNRGFSSCSSPLKPCRCWGKSPVIQRRSLCLGYDVMHNSVHNHSITLLIFALLKEQPPPRFLDLTTTQRAYLSTCDFLRVARILVWWISMMPYSVWFSFPFILENNR